MERVWTSADGARMLDYDKDADHFWLRCPVAGQDIAIGGDELRAMTRSAILHDMSRELRDIVEKAIE